jgi:hypothetical protein
MDGAQQVDVKLHDLTPGPGTISTLTFNDTGESRTILVSLTSVSYEAIIDSFEQHFTDIVQIFCGQSWRGPRREHYGSDYKFSGHY